MKDNHRGMYWSLEGHRFTFLRSFPLPGQFRVLSIVSEPLHRKSPVVFAFEVGLLGKASDSSSETCSLCVRSHFRISLDTFFPGLSAYLSWIGNVYARPSTGLCSCLRSEFCYGFNGPQPTISRLVETDLEIEQTDIL